MFWTDKTPLDIHKQHAKTRVVGWSNGPADTKIDSIGSFPDPIPLNRWPLPSCSRVFFWTVEMAGFVYVLSNESMPGLVKIGSTTEHPQKRASQLRTTGVPTPFKVEFAVWVEDHIESEQLAHERLQDDRCVENREFFRIDVFEAIEAIVCGESFCGAMAFQNALLAVPEPDVCIIADQLEIAWPEVPLVLSRLNREQLQCVKQMLRGGAK